MISLTLELHIDDLKVSAEITAPTFTKLEEQINGVMLILRDQMTTFAGHRWMSQHVPEQIQ